MKNALISPNEIAYDPYTGQVLGWRVAQVVPNGPTFPVGDPLFWMACTDDVVADQFYYDPTTKQILAKPPRPVAGQVISSGTKAV